MKFLRLYRKVLFRRDSHPFYNALCAFLSSVLLLFFFSIDPYLENSYYADNRQIDADTVSVAKDFEYSESGGSTLASLKEEALDFRKEQIETLDIYPKTASLVTSFYVNCRMKNTDGADRISVLFTDAGFNVSNLVYLGEGCPFPLPENTVFLVRGPEVSGKSSVSAGAFLSSLDEGVKKKTFDLEELKDNDRQSVARDPYLTLLILSDSEKYWDSFEITNVRAYYTLTFSSALSRTELVRLSSLAGANLNFGGNVFDGFVHPLRNYLSRMSLVYGIVRVGLYLVLIVELAMFLFKVTSAVLAFRKNRQTYLNQRKLGYPRKNMLCEYALSQTLTFLAGYLLSLLLFVLVQRIFVACGGYSFFSRWYISLLCFIPFALTLIAELVYRYFALEWQRS